MRLSVRAPSLPWRRFGLVALVAALALVGQSFARLVVADQQLKAQEQELRREVALLQVDNGQLQARIAYLQTDAAVERLAREELGWVKPGDTAVVVVRATPSDAEPGAKRIASPANGVTLP